MKLYIVVQNYTNYNAKAIRILSDMEYYQQVQGDPFSSVQSTLQTLLVEAQRNKVITKKESNSILIAFPSKPFFYHLPKVHKCLTNPPGHPIISGINSSASNLSHYIYLILQDYLCDLDSFLKDSD